MKDELYQETLFRCGYCGCSVTSRTYNNSGKASSSLANIAHITPYKETQDNSFENLIVLCPNCHTKIDNGAVKRNELKNLKMRWMVASGRYRKDELDLLRNLFKAEASDKAGVDIGLEKRVVLEGFEEKIAKGMANYLAKANSADVNVIQNLPCYRFADPNKGVDLCISPVNFLLRLAFVELYHPLTLQRNRVAFALMQELDLTEKDIDTMQRENLQTVWVVSEESRLMDYRNVIDRKLVKCCRYPKADVAIYLADLGREFCEKFLPIS